MSSFSIQSKTNSVINQIGSDEAPKLRIPESASSKIVAAEVAAYLQRSVPALADED